MALMSVRFEKISVGIMVAIGEVEGTANSKCLCDKPLVVRG